MKDSISTDDVYSFLDVFEFGYNDVRDKLKYYEDDEEILDREAEKLFQKWSANAEQGIMNNYARGALQFIEDLDNNKGMIPEPLQNLGANNDE